MRSTMSFEELDHTADVLMRMGATINEVFADAGRAMFHVMCGLRGPGYRAADYP